MQKQKISSFKVYSFTSYCDFLQNYPIIKREVINPFNHFYEINAEAIDVFKTKSASLEKYHLKLKTLDGIVMNGFGQLVLKKDRDFDGSFPFIVDGVVFDISSNPFETKHAQVLIHAKIGDLLRLRGYLSELKDIDFGIPLRYIKKV